MKTMNDMELHGMCSNILHKVTPIDNDNTAVQIRHRAQNAATHHEHSNIVVSR